MCNNRDLVIGVDPGDSIVGVAFLSDIGIQGAFNIDHPSFWSKISAIVENSEWESITVALEDLAPYSLRITQQVIDTAKFIGETTYRLKRDYPAVNLVLIKRNTVKKWVFDNFPAICGPLVAQKIDKKLFPACKIDDRQEIRVDNNGRPARKGSFNYVDDAVVKVAMAAHYKIEKPKPGYGYAHGLKDHNWQALAVATYYTNAIAYANSILDNKKAAQAVTPEPQ